MKKIKCDLCRKQITKQELDDGDVVSTDTYANICKDCQRTKKYKVKIVISGIINNSRLNFDQQLMDEMYWGWFDSELHYKLTEVHKIEVHKT